jgi:hypothetical protein
MDCMSFCHQFASVDPFRSLGPVLYQRSCCHYKGCPYDPSLDGERNSFEGQVWRHLLLNWWVLLRATHYKKSNGVVCRQDRFTGDWRLEATEARRNHWNAEKTTCGDSLQYCKLVSKTQVSEQFQLVPWSLQILHAHQYVKCQEWW